MVKITAAFALACALSLADAGRYTVSLAVLPSKKRASWHQSINQMARCNFEAREAERSV